MSQFNMPPKPGIPNKPAMQPYGPGPYPVGTSGKATASLLLGLLSVCFAIFTGLPAVILGILALIDISRSEGRLRGAGTAIAGLVFGGLGSTGAFTGVLVALLLPAVQASREAARRIQSSNNLKQIGLGMQNYHDTNKTYPPAGGSEDSQDGYRLSWRVRLLPYCERKGAYGRFDFNRTWNEDPNNRLIDPMPPYYASPNSESSKENKTIYLAVVGEDPQRAQRPDMSTVFHRGTMPTKMASIPDGTSNTIMVVEADDDQAAIWTRPKDWDFDPQNPRRGLGNLRPGGFLAVFADGSVHYISNNVDDETLRRLFARADGKPIPEDVFD